MELSNQSPSHHPIPPLPAQPIAMTETLLPRQNSSFASAIPHSKISVSFSIVHLTLFVFYIFKFEVAVLRVKQGDETARSDIIENARKFSLLLSHHIHKENEIFYQMNDQVLSSDDQYYLLQAFEKRKMELGSDVHYQYNEMVEEMEREFGHLQQNILSEKSKKVAVKEMTFEMRS